MNIKFEEVAKIYEISGNNVLALQGVDFEVKEQEMLGIIGKSGSGKSTILNIIGGDIKPSAGNFLIDGININKYSEKDLKRYRQNRIGYVLQESSENLLKYLTVLENVELPMCFHNGNVDEKWAHFLLEKVGLDKYLDKYLWQLSGGEKQRCAIAVALANKPELLLADEPTGNLDSKTSSEIYELFRMLQKDLKLTIIIVTHDLKLAKKVDRVIEIVGGRIKD